MTVTVLVNSHGLNIILSCLLTEIILIENVIKKKKARQQQPRAALLIYLTFFKKEHQCVRDEDGGVNMIKYIAN